jgi:hypothetical protein
MNKLRELLEEIACLGNGTVHGNSVGNRLAEKAIEELDRLENTVRIDFRNKKTRVTPLFPYPYCCICYEQISEETCWQDPNGIKWDICKPCAEVEETMKAEEKKPIDEVAPLDAPQCTTTKICHWTLNSTQYAYTTGCGKLISQVDVTSKRDITRCTNCGGIVICSTLPKEPT